MEQKSGGNCPRENFKGAIVRIKNGVLQVFPKYSQSYDVNLKVKSRPKFNCF